MRLLGLGVLALLLIGTLVVLGQSGAFDSAWNRAAQNDVESFADQDRGASASSDVEGEDVFATPTGMESPAILSGLPSYANLAFQMPRDERPVDGVLELAFTTRVAEGVEGALRVSINGAKRADYLLREGSSSSQLEVELTADDLSSSVLNVGVSLQGRGSIEECSSDDSIAAVVQIEPKTGIRMTLTGPPSSVADHLAIWGGRVPVRWVGDTEAVVRGTTIYHAAVLFNKGYRPLFTRDGGLSSQVLDLVATQSVIDRRTSFENGEPLQLTRDPANRGVRKFTRRASWRYSYREDDLPGGTVPSALDLRMVVGPPTDRLERDLTVTLNNRLLLSRRLDSATDRFNQSILVPAGLHSWDNALDITVSSSDADDVRCGDITQSAAELLPETVLRTRTRAETDLGPLAELRGALNAAGRISLETGELTPSDAQAGALLLSRLGPRGWQLADGRARAKVRIISGSDIASVQAASGTRNQWLVYRENGDNGRVLARRTSSDSAARLPAVALLVSLPAAAQRQNQNQAR